VLLRWFCCGFVNAFVDKAKVDKVTAKVHLKGTLLNINIVYWTVE